MNHELQGLLFAYPKILLLINQRTNSREVMINPENKDYKHKSEGKIKDKDIEILFSKV